MGLKLRPFNEKKQALVRFGSGRLGVKIRRTHHLFLCLWPVAATGLTMAFHAMLLVDRLIRRDVSCRILRMDGLVKRKEKTYENGRQGQHGDYSSSPDAYRSVSNPDQLFLVVRAMKLVISCSNFLLPHAGQVAWPLSCSFSVIAMRDSFPHARHL
jgi:hypothetical protein